MKPSSPSSLTATLHQFNHLLQSDLLPRLGPTTGPLDDRACLFLTACVTARFSRFLPYSRLGRRPADRLALANAFLAKALFNLSTTRALIAFLSHNHPIRQLCGWRNPEQLPHESTFSRAFALIAAAKVPERSHQALVDDAFASRLVGHISRDATAINARESVADSPTPKADNKESGKINAKPAGKRKHTFARRKHRPEDNAATRIEHQMLTTDVNKMLADIPTHCSIGVKRSTNGHNQYWRGYKLHLDAADGQIPVSAVLSSAHVHDSQLAVPLMHLTSSRIDYCYDLMDTAYDARTILQTSRDLNHVPIVDPKTLAPSKSQLPARQAEHDDLQRRLSPAEKDRYRERTTVERCFARLKDEFGFRNLRVRGPVKVMAHLMFGILVLTVDQLRRLAP